MPPKKKAQSKSKSKSEEKQNNPADFDGDVSAFNNRDPETDDNGNEVAAFRAATGHNEDAPEDSGAEDSGE